MKNKTRYIAGGVTIAAVATAAHLMQSQGAGSAVVSQSSVLPVAAAAASTAAPVAKTDTDPANSTQTGLPAAAPFVGPAIVDPEPVQVAASDVPVVPADARMPNPLPQIGSALRDRLALSGDAPSATEPLADEPLRSEFGLSCGPILTASAGDIAMVSLTLTAPCKGGEGVIVRHGDLVFSDQMNKFGTFTVMVPVMTSAAGFSIEFADGTFVQTDLEVPLPAGLERVALQYSGDAGLQIHALEFGADYDEDGHVWSGAPRDATHALKSGGGYLTLLGTGEMAQARYAEVYTFPGDAGGGEGQVQLSIQAQVTERNCGTELGGQTIERIAEDATNTVTLTVAMPQCDAVGEYLVLKNLLRDLKVASN